MTAPADTPETLLAVRNGHKTYRVGSIETHALFNVDFQIARGEFVSVMGRSGSGKSTLLAILGLMDTLSSGAFSAFGRDASTLSRADRAYLRNRQIGFVFQFFHLIADLSVEENIALPMYQAGASRRDIERRVAETTERLGIAHRRRHHPFQLSGGQQQRVAIARAIANQPSVLLVDEPTGNLDSESGEQVMALLTELWREDRVAICLVTHDPQCAVRAQRQVLMKDGLLTSA